MKFDFIIGNPPYHYETGRRKIPMYPDFVMSASDPLLSGVTCLITPDGFIKGGQQLEPLRKYMEGNPHLCSIDFHKDQVFPGKAVDAAIMLFDNKHTYNNVNKTITFPNGKVDKGIVDWAYRDVIPNEVKQKILELFETKILSESDMSSIITSWAPFGLNTKSYKSNKDKFKDNSDSSHTVRILVGEEKEFYWISADESFSYEGNKGRMEKVVLNNADKWKMVFPKAGFVEQRPLTTWILKPGEIFTDKYLCVFADSENEAENIQKYFTTKFYRAGLGSKATSWNLYKGWHSNVPQQDFTSASDIDWSKSVDDINRQLYVKYRLSSEEIRLIEAFIKG